MFYTIQKNASLSNIVHHFSLKDGRACVTPLLVVSAPLTLNSNGALYQYTAEQVQLDL